MIFVAMTQNVSQYSPKKPRYNIGLLRY